MKDMELGLNSFDGPFASNLSRQAYWTFWKYRFDSQEKATVIMLIRLGTATAYLVNELHIRKEALWIQKNSRNLVTNVHHEW